MIIKSLFSPSLSLRVCVSLYLRNTFGTQFIIHMMCVCACICLFRVQLKVQLVFLQIACGRRRGTLNLMSNAQVFVFVSLPPSLSLEFEKKSNFMPVHGQVSQFKQIHVQPQRYYSLVIEFDIKII